MRDTPSSHCCASNCPLDDAGSQFTSMSLYLSGSEPSLILQAAPAAIQSSLPAAWLETQGSAACAAGVCCLCSRGLLPVQQGLLPVQQVCCLCSRGLLPVQHSCGTVRIVYSHHACISHGIWQVAGAPDEPTSNHYCRQDCSTTLQC